MSHISWAQQTKQARNVCGLSQREFAVIMGVHTMTISKWERSVTAPNAYQQQQLALLNVYEIMLPDVRLRAKELIEADLGAKAFFVLAAAGWESPRD